MRDARDEIRSKCQLQGVRIPRDVSSGGGGAKNICTWKAKGKIWEWEKEKRIPLKPEFKNNIKAKNLVFIAENDGISERNSSG